MSDAKDNYSNASSSFVGDALKGSEESRRLYDKSKRREARHNDDWVERAVSINDLVQQFAPNADGYRSGVKYIYRGDRYTVVADMASGYVRIFDNIAHSYVDRNGRPCRNERETHFKIKRREEM